MQKIYLIRHGETDWNLEKRFQGRENVPLNGKGKKQAQLLARRLKEKELTAVYSSPLSRARETAEIIGAVHGLTPCIVEKLGEISFGSLEGKKYTELNENERKIIDRWMVDPETVSIPRGETFKQFRERILESYNELLNVEQEGDLAIVTHGGAIKVLVADILKVPFSRFAALILFPGSLTTILYDNRRNSYLELFNDVCHLQKIF